MKYIYLCLCFLLSLIGWGQESTEKLGEILVQVEQAPAWNGCEKKSDTKACTEEMMNLYIQKHLNYPKAARTEKIEGNVIISCIINKEGKILNPGIVKDIGGGCGDEALRIVRLMPLWQPPFHKGKTVNVIHHITIPFSLGILPYPDDKPSPKIVYEEPVKPIIPFDTLPKGNMDIDKQLLPDDYEDTNIGRVYTRVSQMPYLSGCYTEGKNFSKKRACSNKKLIAYLQTSLVYPEEAKKKKIEGIVAVSFIIDEKGAILNPKIIRDIGGGCGDEAIRVVSNMPKWEAGKHKKRAVKTKMTLPIRFYLSNGSSTRYKIHWGGGRKDKLTLAQIQHSLKEDFIVRNLYGDNMTITSLSLEYEKGRRLREANSNGKFTHEMSRLLRRAKAGGKLLISATIQEHGKLIEVQRLFDIVK